MICLCFTVHYRMLQISKQSGRQVPGIKDDATEENDLQYN